MTELITIVITILGVGLAIATINITTFLYLLGRLASVEKGLSMVEKEVAFIHGLLVHSPNVAATDE